MFDVDIDLTELKAKWAKGVDELGKDLEASSFLAAKDGVEAEQARHPYTDRTGDLTGSAHADPRAKGAAMVWPQDYASFVDRGTSHSKPYPFTPEAERVATKSLEIRATLDAETLCDRMNK